MNWSIDHLWWNASWNCHQIDEPDYNIFEVKWWCSVSDLYILCKHTHSSGQHKTMMSITVSFSPYAMLLHCILAARVWNILYQKSAIRILEIFLFGCHWSPCAESFCLSLIKSCATPTTHLRYLPETKINIPPLWKLPPAPRRESLQWLGPLESRVVQVRGSNSNNQSLFLLPFASRCERNGSRQWAGSSWEDSKGWQVLHPGVKTHDLLRRRADMSKIQVEKEH